MGVYCLSKDEDSHIELIKCSKLLDYMPLNVYPINGLKIRMR